MMDCRKNRLGKYNEEEMAALAKEKEEQEAEERKRYITGLSLYSELRRQICIIFRSWIQIQILIRVKSWIRIQDALE
jgi:hypothetical protein